MEDYAILVPTSQPRPVEPLSQRRSHDGRMQADPTIASGTKSQRLDPCSELRALRARVDGFGMPTRNRPRPAIHQFLFATARFERTSIRPVAHLRMPSGVRSINAQCLGEGLRPACQSATIRSGRNTDRERRSPCSSTYHIEGDPTRP
jgi:hypothetical protein